ncbi:hypothetical protein HPB50_020700 [Hyalomma asiaticum]|uniref:Uncharacterized protein n=1 Tax=Hyalomma asiaticum TaxID=266040 RepID=A0ACB7S129_HYAAI|nr:hypothetical protein HPB50_020700 [Hyalomma asiaticum]
MRAFIAFSTAGNDRKAGVTCERSQFPLVQASAITVHKSQGATYSEVVYEYAKNHPQKLVYVALSRCTDVNNLYLTNATGDHCFHHRHANAEFGKNDPASGSAKYFTRALPIPPQQGFVVDMESSQRQVLCENVEGYFFSSWPYEDRLILRKFYDLYVAKWVYLMQQNEAAGGRQRDDCSQWSLWRSLSVKLRSSCNRSVQEEEIEHFFRRVICGVSRASQVSDLLDSLLFPEQLFVVVADDGDDASYRNEGEDGPDVKEEVIEVVDAPEPHIAASGTPAAREHVEEMNECDVLGATGWSLLAQQRTLWKGFRPLSNGAHEAVPPGRPSESDMLTAVKQEFVADVENSQRKVVSDNGERYFFSSWPYEDRLCLRKFYDGHVAKWAYLMQQNEAAGGRLRDDCSQWSLWRSAAMALRSSCNRLVQEVEIEYFFRQVICGVSRPDQVCDLLDSLLFPERLFVAVADAGDNASDINEGEDGPDVKQEVTEVVDAPEPHIAASGTSTAREHVKEVNECHVLGATGWCFLAEQRASRKGFRPLSDCAYDAVPPAMPSECDRLTAAQQEFVRDVENSHEKVVSDNGERYFFSSWPYEDRLCLRKFYDLYVAKWVYLMQQNEAAGGRRRDDCSQWSLWRSLSVKLRSSCNRSVQEKVIEHFFRRVICGVASPDQVSDLLDSLLFPEQLFVDVADAGDNASDRNESEDGAEVQREVMEVVDAPEPHIDVSSACGTREHFGEKTMNDLRVLGATGRILPAEQHFGEKTMNDLHVLGATGRILPAEQRTSPESLRLVPDCADEPVPAGRPSECDKLTGANQSDVVSVFSENDTSAGVLGDDVTIDISIVGRDSDDHDIVLAGIRVPAPNAQDDEVLERIGDAAVDPSTDTTVLPVPHVTASAAGVADLGDNAAVDISGNARASPMLHDWRWSAWARRRCALIERGDDTGVSRSTDSTALPVSHSEASIVGVPERGDDTAVVTSEDSTTFSSLHVRASIPDVLQHGNHATFATLGIGVVSPVQQVRTSTIAAPKHGDGAAVGTLGVGTSASPRQDVVTSIVRALECGDDAAVATSDATALPVPRLGASIVEPERVGEAAVAISEEDAASPSHIGTSIAGALGLGDNAAVDEATLAVPHVAASITGVRELGDGETVANSGDADTLPFLHVGATTARSYCANGHFGSKNLIYGSHSEGSYSAEEDGKCRIGGLEEDICGSACESPCSVGNPCDKEIQHTPERVHRGVQCEINSDDVNEFMEAEDTVLIEITRLYQLMLQMQEDPME